jgi:DNA polymerase I-like protein with 3'-5' exonuclease and polymerase domains
VRWLLQLHDALLFQMDEELVEVVQPVVEEGMVQGCGMKLRVPIVVDSHTAQSWGSL